MAGMCAAPGCQKAAAARGYCHVHYNKARRHGHLPVSQPLCAADGCTSPATTRGYCHSHYSYLKRHGATFQCSEDGCSRPAAYGEQDKCKLHMDPNRQRQRSTCTVDGCDRPLIARGLCTTHYARARKRGLIPTRGVCTEEGCSKPEWAKGRCKNHYDKQRADRRDARRRGAAVVDLIDRKRVFETAGWVCAICGEPVDRCLQYPDPRSASLDHILPLARGGTHTRDNVQLAHLSCNMRKGAYHATYC